MRTFCFGMAVAMGSLAAFAVDYTSVEWQATGGAASGSWTDSAHWNPSVAGGPGTGYPDSSANLNQKAILPRLDRDYTVTLPSGDWTNVATFVMKAARGRTVTLDGSDTVLTLPALTGGTYGQFLLHANTEDGDGNPTDDGLLLKCGAADTATARGELSNVTAVLSGGTAARPGTQLEMAGTVNWTGGDIVAFGGSASDADGRASLVLRDGSLTGTKFFCALANYTNVLTLSGFTMNADMALYLYGGCIPNGVPALFELNMENGSYYSTESEFILGYSIPSSSWRLYSTNKTFRINVSGGSTFAACVNGKTRTSNTGHFEINVTGTDSLLNLTGGTAECLFGTNGNASTAIRISDGAKLSATSSIQIGGGDTPSAATSAGYLSISNATLTNERKIQINNGELRLVDVDATFSGYRENPRFCGGNVAGATSAFYAEGVVLHLQIHSQLDSILHDFDTAKLGSRGLTIYNEGKRDVSVRQAFTDWSTGGTLSVGGYVGYPITLTGADSEESNLNIVKNTVILGSGANHHSHVTVTNNATFSLVGDCTAATLRSLTLGNALTKGTLALDDGDIVTVEGAINLVNPRFSFSAELTSGSHAVIRCAAEPTATALSLWETRVASYISSGSPSGAYVHGDVVKVGSVWEYRVVVDAAKPSRTGTTSWPGGNGIWSDANWSDGLPGTTNTASFASDTAQTVTVEDTVDAAALAFAGPAATTVTGGRVRLSDNTSAAIDVTAGDHVIASRLQVAGRVPVDVAADASLTLSGSAYGGFEKTGAGRLVVSCTDSAFPFGLSLTAGWLSLTDIGSLITRSDDTASSLTGGTLETTGTGGSVSLSTSLTSPMVFKTESDLTMPAPSMPHPKTGAILKRGAGRLVFEASADTYMSICPCPDADFSGYSSADVVSFPSDGSAPAKYNGLTVFEGEMVFRGTGSSVPNFSISKAHYGKNISIGAPLETAPSASPGLVIDHAKVSGNHIFVGRALQQQDIAPYVIVTNGGVLSATYNASGNASRTKPVRLYVDNGTVSGSLCPNTQNDTIDQAVTNVCTFVNGSFLLASSAVLQGPALVTFDSSYFLKTSDTAHPEDRTKWTEGTMQAYGSSGKPGSLTLSLANESIFSCSWIYYSYKAQYYDGFKCDFTFDNSEWWAGDGYRVLPTTNFPARVVTTGGGLIQVPSEGSTYRWVTPVTGDGGFVKRGAGTVRFDPQIRLDKLVTSDPVTLAYAGLTDIQAGLFQIDMTAISNFTGRAFRVGGTLDILGGTLTGAKIFAAGGTLKNGTYADVTIGFDPATGSTLTIDGASGAAQSGNGVIDFGRAKDDPVELGATYVVAAYTGGATPPTYWRARNLGLDRSARITIVDGQVRATIRRPPGMRLLIR